MVEIVDNGDEGAIRTTVDASYIETIDSPEAWVDSRKARAWRCLWCDKRGKGDAPENDKCPRCNAQSLAVFRGPQFDKLEMP